MDLKVICLDEPAFYELIEKVYNRLKAQNDTKQEKWLSGEEAMKKLKIKSKTTLSKLRNSGSIRFTQPPEAKIILYDAESIDAYLEASTRETF